MAKHQLPVIAAELAEIFRCTQDKTELQTLLLGLLTPRELEEIHRRWHLLEGLHEGRTQREIRDQLGISLGKIARGSRLMQYGDDDFVDIFKRILKETQAGNTED